VAAAVQLVLVLEKPSAMPRAMWSCSGSTGAGSSEIGWKDIQLNEARPALGAAQHVKIGFLTAEIMKDRF